MEFLGLDLGTTNVKALRADGQARVRGRGSAAVLLRPGPRGAVEQDIEEIWRAAGEAIRQALAGSSGKEIKGIGISSQGAALQPMDVQGNPRGPVISWLDGRGREEDERNNQQLGPAWFAQRIGHWGSGMAIGQIQRLRRQGSGSPARFGFVGDVLVERLCGSAGHDATSAAITLLLNPRTGAYDDGILALLGLEAGQLPPIVPAHCPAGGLREEVAASLGLPAGIPVSPAVHDQYAAALGVGAAQPGTVMFGAGTAWVLLAILEECGAPVTEDAFLAPHVVEGLFGQILSLHNGGSAVTWAMAMTGLEKKEGSLDTRLAGIPAGSEGLLCAPLLAPTAPAGLGPEAAGAITGLRLTHTPAHFLRAVIEGLGYELNRHLLMLRRAQFPVEQLSMGGGAAASRVTTQIIADITGLPVACAAESESSLVGALILARRMHEPDRSWTSLVEEMGTPGRLVAPGADQSFYSDAYREYEQLLVPWTTRP